MFYCESCRIKNQWTRGLLGYETSYGPCECCHRTKPTYDVHSSALKNYMSEEKEFFKMKNKLKKVRQKNEHNLDVRLEETKEQSEEAKPEFVFVPILRGFTEIKKIFDIINTYGFICGGYARFVCSPIHKPIETNDLDVYLTNADRYQELRDKLMNEYGFSVKHENEISLTFKNNENFIGCPTVQLIKPLKEGRVVAYGTVYEILRNFDFTITRAAILNSEECIVDSDFVEDEKHKQIVIKTIHCPISSTLRCIKYSKKGYWLRPKEALKLFQDWQNRSEEYRNKITELFNKSDEFNPDSPDTSKMTQEEIDQLEKLLWLD